MPPTRSRVPNGLAAADNTVPRARARLPWVVRPAAAPAFGLFVVLAVVFLVAETVLVILLKQVDPRDPVGVVIAVFMGLALVANVVVGVAAARAVLADRRREADLAAELARVMLGAIDLRSALDRAGECLAEALKLSFAALGLDEVAGDERRLAIPLRDGATVLGTLVVPVDLPTVIQQRLRQRVVPSLEALLAAVRDREHISTELIESRQALDRFFNLSSDMLCITGLDRVIMINPAFERTLGYTIEELASRHYLDIVDPADRDHVRAVLDGPSRDKPERYENRIICRDGSRRWVEWSVTSHRGVLYAAGRDVTDRRREQDQLQQAQAMLEASRDRLNALAEQQAALRRVATLVAEGANPSDVLDAVAEEMGQCLKVAGAAVSRYEEDSVAMVAVAPVPPEVKDMVPLGKRFPLEGDNVHTRVIRTGRAARMDNYNDATGAGAEQMRELGVKSIVAVPILVGARVWGAATAGSVGDPMPSDTETRMSDFADLVATAIANAAARAELQASRDSLGVLAAQQAALRRVATLVAREVDPSEVFSAVAEEMARCLDVQESEVVRYECSDATIVMASYTLPGFGHPRVGECLTLEGDNIAARVLHTGRTARMDSYEDAAGSLAARNRELGLRSRVGSPIVVGGDLWGLAVVGSSRAEPLPPDTEERITDFAELVATAIAAAATRAELVASRARMVAAADDARRRLERDLHDGAQQRLIGLGLKLRAAEAAVSPEQSDLKNELSEAISELIGVSSELQEISRGIHPAILSQGGLAPALDTLALRSAVPVDLDVAINRPLSDPVEVAAYYAVAEALTNAAKHARASQVTVRAQTTVCAFHLSICDDGIGGADPLRGSGLIGLRDRIEAIGGQLHFTSHPGSGTDIEIAVPLDSA